MSTRTLSTLTAASLAGAALLVPTAAFATPHWGPDHSSHRSTQRATDGLLRWTVKDHTVTLVSPTQGFVPFVYTCGGTEDPVEEQVDPAMFQVVFNKGDYQAGAIADEEQTLPSFECDGTEHTLSWSFTALGNTTFENGNGEVGLARPETQSDPTFEHVVVTGLDDARAAVALTVNASPEPVKKGKTVTVKGTVKRAGKAYKGKQATLYFQADNLGATKVGSAKSSSKGNLKAKVKATKSGTYYWVTSSTSKTQAGTTLGDHVTVKK